MTTAGIESKMARIKDLVYEAIFQKYAPRVKVEGEYDIDTDSRITEVIDPNCLYVGALIDGLIPFMPEMLETTFPGLSHPSNARRKFKTLLQDTLPGDRARHFLAKEWQLTFQRPSWTLNNRGELPEVLIWDRHRQEEPGELVNSPALFRDEEGAIIVVEQVGDDHELGEVKRIVDKWSPKPGRTANPFDPIIRVDKKWGLHLLMRGDRLKCTFKRRDNTPVEMNFELKPPHEGSSLITAEESTSLVLG